MLGSKEEILDGRKPKWIDLMGDNQYFEGFYHIEGNFWEMRLGS